MLAGWKMVQQLTTALLSFLNMMVYTPAPDDIELPVKLWLVIIAAVVGPLIVVMQRVRRKEEGRFDFASRLLCLRADFQN